MRLILIHKQKNGEKTRTLEMFEHSCQTLGIELFLVNVYSYSYFDLPTLGSDDILYRSATGSRAQILEKLLINDSCRHLYTKWDLALHGRGTTYYYHKKHNLPAIPTIPLIPKDREEAVRFAETLGGFPIIMKVTGGSKGVGVMRVDSQESFISICDFLRGNSANILVRKYIEHTYYGRFIVLGGHVIASNRCKSLDGDFRTNTADTPYGEAYVFSEEVQKIAIDAVSVLGLKFGGVDLLFDMDGNAHIAEVNFPTDFGVAQDITGIDVATQILQFLAD
ncbi:hypothetical protein A2592_00920 [Candidatus Kaiserbacteria bacterium RIFOXYD1_FULL_42_15]|uniref:ATP-grasp domain-containing protein n=1 Tax=Candidatus Kaiserbacteria bacterium RIFOXYD1_FULL_42_15 TaxID=1798532 RepID=A0A1F6FPA3_9BACT|nr:MAG: hypothetical protein A2592_00920 [Candidatus Kaiserbacteria bacterium RIFOXYD1_FULL_42_15]